jgi:hypothetical protein
MSSWRLGYPSGLESAASESAGMALYDKFSVLPITLDSTLMVRGVGQVNGNPPDSTSGILTCDNIHVYPSTDDADFPGNTVFTNNEFNNGFVRFLSGNAAGYGVSETENKAFKVDATAANTLTCTGDNLLDAGVLDGDYFEVMTGSPTFTFPSGRNPIRRDFKKVTLLGPSMRMPIYNKGLLLPLGYAADDFVVIAYLTSSKDIDRLEVMLSHTVTYQGFDYPYAYSLGNSDKGAAPMILETGSNDVQNQFLVAVSDWKIIKSAKRSDDFWEVLVHFVGYWKSTHRGI